MDDNLDLNQSERQRSKGMHEDHQPVRWIENLALGIRDDGKAREGIGKPERQAEVPQFFVHIGQVWIEEIPRIPRQHRLSGENDLPVKKDCESQEHCCDSPIGPTQRTRQAQSLSQRFLQGFPDAVLARTGFA